MHIVYFINKIRSSPCDVCSYRSGEYQCSDETAFIHMLVWYMRIHDLQELVGKSKGAVQNILTLRILKLGYAN